MKLKQDQTSIKHNSSRRSFLKTTALGGLAFGASVTFPTWQVFAQNTSIHQNPLAIPKLEKGRIEGDKTIYDLEIQNGITEFVKGVKTKTRGVNGALLGPTLRLQNGNNVRINVKNSIGETTTLHWHGLHLPAKADGGPHQPIKDGQVWSPEFTVKQHAASFWYHPHLMGKTAEHVWQGIAGMIIIDDEDSKNLSLPNIYGIDDIPIVLQDRRFNKKGTMEKYNPSMHDMMDGLKGNVALTNGTLSPYFKATTSLIRLRLLNGSNASIYNLAFSDNRSFHQIATDGSMLETPFKTNQVVLSPGERIEIVVDISGNKNLMLMNKPAGSSASTMMGNMMSDGSQDFNFLEIRPASTLSPSPALPKKLISIDWIDPKQATKTRKFMMSMKMGAMMFGGSTHTINGKVMKMSRIDETIQLGATEIWEISNDSNVPHPFHIHMVQFQIIDRNGTPPAPNELGLKDTVLVHPNERVRFIAKFENYASNEDPYMYHCHILEHEDAGMMGQFLVV